RFDLDWSLHYKHKGNLVVLIVFLQHYMLDLGALINVISSSLYRSLRLGALEPTSVVIQLANKSIAHPLGILEDMMVLVSIRCKKYDSSMLKHFIWS
ncbi:hypothetical protein CR513_56064, partial [Mucuna pruriens]